MKPILFESNETAFTSQGLGVLTDCASAEVLEERNGAYELTIEYPVTGIHYEDIAVDRIIAAIPSPYRDPQPFRIYKVTRPLDGLVTVYARHISYDLSGIPIAPFTASGIQAAFAGLKSNELVASNFNYQTSRITASSFRVAVPSSARSLLGGQEGSFLDVYGGEYTFDGWNVILENARGQDNGVAIRYGKNLTACELEQDSSATYAGCMAYWYQEETGTKVTGPIVYAPGHSGAPVYVLDCSEDYETAPTTAQLRSKAEAYIANNNLAEIGISLTASFVHLDQMDGYEDIAPLEQCDLCDTVTIQYAALGVDVTAKIVSITTDVLLERYREVTVGSIAANLAATIADQIAVVQEKVDKNFLTNAINVATALITGNSGGYVVLYDSDDDGYPDEILVMDSPDIASATKVWRWNQSGLGYSSTGYNGTYSTAITMNGQIVADFILAGTMTADRISGGTLTIGGLNNNNGIITMRDSAGATAGSWDNTGIALYNGKLRTEYTDSETGAVGYGEKGSSTLTGGAVLNSTDYLLYRLGLGKTSQWYFGKAYWRRMSENALTPLNYVEINGGLNNWGMAVYQGDGSAIGAQLIYDLANTRGQLRLADTSGHYRLVARGDGNLYINNASGTSVAVLSTESSSSGGILNIKNASGTNVGQLYYDSTHGGRLWLADLNGDGHIIANGEDCTITLYRVGTSYPGAEISGAASSPGFSVFNGTNTSTRGQLYSSISNDYGILRLSDGNNQWRVQLYGNGQLYLRNASGTQTVTFNGTTGNGSMTGTLTQGSDRRLKTDIRDMPEALVDAFLALKPRLYTLLASGKECAGFVAQEVQGTALEGVLVVRQEDGLLYLDYNSLHALELAALQRMEDRLKRLEEILNGRNAD